MSRYKLEDRVTVVYGNGWSGAATVTATEGTWCSVKMDDGRTGGFVETELMPIDSTESRRVRSRNLIDKVAIAMIDEWEKKENTTVNVSYVATYADMARRVIKDFDVKEK